MVVPKTAEMVELSSSVTVNGRLLEKRDPASRNENSWVWLECLPDNVGFYKIQPRSGILKSHLMTSLCNDWCHLLFGIRFSLTRCIIKHHLIQEGIVPAADQFYKVDHDWWRIGKFGIWCSRSLLPPYCHILTQTSGSTNCTPERLTFFEGCADHFRFIAH